MSNCNNNTSIGDTNKLVADLRRDAGLLHEVVHSDKNEMMVDAGKRKTLKGLTEYLLQIIAENGYKPPVDYSAGLHVSEPHFTVIHDGVVYAPRPDLLPFDTSEPFNPDQWLTLQGLTSIRLGMEDGASLVGHKGGSVAEVLIDMSFDSGSDVAVQNNIGELDFGVPDSGVGTIFPGAWRAPQQFEIDGSDVYVIQAVTTVPQWASSERCRISKWGLDGGDRGEIIEYTPELSIGHGTGLSLYAKDGSLYIYSSMPTKSVDSSGVNSGKGWSKIHYRGAETTQNDIQSFQVFGNEGSGHRLQDFRKAAVSFDPGTGQVALVANNISTGGKALIIYDALAVESSNDPLSVPPIMEAPLDMIDGEYLTMQSFCFNSGRVYSVWGQTAVFSKKAITIHNTNGHLMNVVYFDGALSKYTADQLLGGVGGAIPSSMEPEGICIYNGFPAIIMTDNWSSPKDVVSFQNRNWACISDNTNTPPFNEGQWTQTTLQSNRGEWSGEANYNKGILKKAVKVIYTIKPQSISGEGNYVGSSGLSYPLPTHSNNSAMTNPQRAVSKPYGRTWAVQSYIASLNKSYPSFGYYDGCELRMYDERGFDNHNYSSVASAYGDTLKGMLLRARNGSISYGSGLNLYANDDPTHSGEIKHYVNGRTAVHTKSNGETTFQSASGQLAISMNMSGEIVGGIGGSSVAMHVYASEGKFLRMGVNKTQWEIAPTGIMRPAATNSLSLGQPAHIIKDIYLGSPPVILSDERAKQEWSTDIAPELRAWAKVKFGKYRFKDSIELKGGAARWHFGVLAQQVKSAFESEGLDPFEYGILCHDEWQDEYEVIYDITRQETENGEVEEKLVDTGRRKLVKRAGDQYGIRYEEAFALECALIRSKMI